MCIRDRVGYEFLLGWAFCHLGAADIATRNEPDRNARDMACLLYTSDAADERSSVDLGGRRIIKKKNR